MTSNETTISGRFRDQEIIFANGSRGINIDIPSASPVNYFQVLNAPGDMPAITLDGKLFLPPGTSNPVPLIMIIPGSLGVAPSHVSHAETLNAAGFATFVLDCFGARAVTSTVANQTQFSFAASAYDVLAAYSTLSKLPEIDPSRIGAQGHSRGGSAVMIAATRCFAAAVVGADQSLAAVLAAYPWCGQQFLDPGVGTTEVRVLMGDADEWCSPMQVQGHCHAIRLSGGDASMRLIGGAQHSFDRDTPVTLIPDAAVAPAAPITYIDNNGAMIHPTGDAPDPALVDRDVMVYAVKAGYGVTGARIGSAEGEAKLFRDDMLGFWKRVLGNR
ncbi:MAG: dienelactone hydrolase family protein [Gammaproteobacteria bacterium]|nr:dienelactone hydrolase family protein [Gammaproteobacteria bacterium]